jgi:hypothetical protein
MQLVYRYDPVLYFADDDNEYHPDLFRQLSKVGLHTLHAVDPQLESAWLQPL